MNEIWNYYNEEIIQKKFNFKVILFFDKIILADELDQFGIHLAFLLLTFQKTKF